MGNGPGLRDGAGPVGTGYLVVGLGEYDVAPGGHLVEFTDGDHTFHLRDEIVRGQAKHVNRGLAGVEFAT